MNNALRGANSRTTLAGLIITATVSLSALGQQPLTADKLVGTWTLVSSVGTRDGARYTPFGENPDGILMFDSGGRYSIQICRPGRAKFASNNREKGTPEENQATVQGCNPHWGRYTVADGAITFAIERAMFPNWEGLQQKRPATLNGDEMKYVVPASSAGGTTELTWRRAK